MRINNPMKKPEVREKASVTHTGRRFSSERLEEHKRICNQPEVILNKSIAAKKWYENIEHRIKQKEAMNRPEVIAKCVINAKKQWRDPKFKASMSGENSPHWRGGSSSFPYPAEFNEELKESIRERDNRICQMPGCGKTEAENGRNLDVHHIDCNRINCSEENLISLCFDCHNKTKHNRIFWEAVFTCISQLRFMMRMRT
jgi:hypothetical protein